MKIIIIGAGITGLSAARNLEGCDVKIFEKNKRIGGLCRTEESSGFKFDYTGHYLHFNNSEIKEEVLSLFSENEINKRQRKAYIYISGKFVPYPFQSHIYYLPENIRRECLMGFLNILKEPLEEPGNFFSWMKSRFGEGITGHFLLPYNKKMWTVHPEYMSTQWMGRFMPRPSAEEVISGAVSEVNKQEGYNADFYYPSGGIERLAEKLVPAKAEIFLNSKVEKVYSREKYIESAGKKYPYDKLIVTAPLKSFALEQLDDEAVAKEAAKLKNNFVLNINIGWERRTGSKVPEDVNWIYFPEEEYDFYRVGFSAAADPSMVPDKCRSCYVEIAYAADNVPGRDKFKDIEQDTIKQLKVAGIIPESAPVRTVCTLPIKNAYVIYDMNWKESREYILNRLEEMDIFCAGRYGGWEYSSMEDALLRGKRIADKCLIK